MYAEHKCWRCFAFFYSPNAVFFLLAKCCAFLFIYQMLIIFACDISRMQDDVCFLFSIMCRCFLFFYHQIIFFTRQKLFIFACVCMCVFWERLMCWGFCVCVCVCVFTLQMLFILNVRWGDDDDVCLFLINVGALNVLTFFCVFFFTLQMLFIF